MLGRLAGAGNGRTCADLAAELSDAIALLHDAVAEVEALIDITVDEPLTHESQDITALGAAARFLGRRLFESNAAEICELHPELRPLLILVLAGHVLAALTRHLGN